MDELIPTRASLLNRLKNWQDQSSWQEFFDTYWKLIYRVAVKTGLTESEAEDVVQETLITVAKHMPGFKYDPAIGSFKAWLLNLTRWRIVDQQRRRWRLPVTPLLEETNNTGTRLIDKIPDETDQNLTTLWEAEWENNLLQAATTRVKRRVAPRHYQIFDLYVNKRWTATKVAEAHGIPVAQVYLTKHRITDALKEEVRLLESRMV